MRKPEWDEGESPGTTAERIAELVGDPDPTTRRLAIGHSKATATQQQRAASDPDKRVRREAARGNQTPANLTALADDPYDSCRWAALANPGIPSSKLASVADAADADDLNTLINIAANPSAPAATLATLSKHADESIRRAARQ